MILPRRNRTGRPGAVGALLVALLAALVLATIGAAQAGAAPSAADEAATHAYLDASLGLESALTAATRSARAPIEATVQALTSECPDALAGAPKPSGFVTLPIGEPNASFRARGESQRLLNQLAAIQEELAIVPQEPLAAADRGPIEAFAAAVAPLRWSSPDVATAVSDEVRGLQVTPPAVTTAQVCADIHSWSASGYTALSPSTRELLSEYANGLGVFPFEGSRAVLRALRPFEGAAERSQLKALSTATTHFEAALVATLEAEFSLDRKLGYVEEESPRPVRHKGTLIARRRLASGGELRVTARRLSGSQVPRRVCSSEVTFTYSLRKAPRSALLGAFTDSNGSCYGPASPRHVEVGCDDGVLTVEGQLPSTARTIELRLSNGRMLTGGAIRVPGKLGGPLALYYQAVKGPSPYPVGLTVRGAGGRVLESLHLRPHRHCSRRGEQTLMDTVASGPTPIGRDFDLAALGTVGARRGPQLIANIPTDQSFQLFEESTRLRGFHWSISVDCAPQAVTIVYGLLSAPGETVEASTTAGPVEFTSAALPSSFHSQARAAYGVFTTPPRSLTIHSASGAVVASEDLSTLDAHEAEFCEGYGES